MEKIVFSFHCIGNQRNREMHLGETWKTTGFVGVKIVLQAHSMHEKRSGKSISDMHQS